MKYISFLNTFSFYQLWNNGYKGFIIDFINKTIDNYEEYKLLDFINFEKNNVRSYLIFESNNNIVMIDFNLYNSSLLVENDLSIINFLKITTSKKVSLIMFNKTNNNDLDNKEIFNINFDNNSIFFANSKSKQLKLNKGITNILYKMDIKLLGLYMHEIYLKMRM